ncbi:MAG: TonB-dependent receptor [Bryobacterales bacterium]|nr:TonB-dependent receptor [Bryobacterales bacterium]
MLPKILVCWILWIAAATGMFAQSGAGGGSIQGTVKDPTGAVVPGVKIVITHLATNRVTNTESNTDGYYATPPLPIGKYKVRVSMEGMKTWESEITIETGKTAVVDPLLTPGQVTETVQVTDSVPLVTTTDPTDASTLDAQRIQEIPINGRNLNVLLEDVTPGVEAINDVNGGVRVSGLMTYSTDYVQDGAAANNREFGGSANLQGLESIGEVRIETSTSSAKYTRPTSVIVTTKSGSNQLKVGVYETHRNNAFGVARARQDVFFDGRPFQTPKLIRNEFGGSIGGPIILPKPGIGEGNWYNGKNRSFFFVSREGVELVQGLTREFRVPTAAMREGDFSSLIDAQGRRLQLYDPLSTRMEDINGRLVSVRDPFQNNQIPIQRLNAFAKRIYEITPLPTDITNPVVANNLKMVVPTNGFPNLSDNPLTIRVDHRFTNKDNVFFKLNGGTRRADFMGTGGTTGAPTANKEANVTFLPVRGRSAAISWIHTFGPSLFVETLANRTWQISRTVTGPVDKDWSKELGLPNPLGEIGWPNITSAGFMNYVEGDNRRQLYSMISNLEQNYTYIKRTHNIAFGFRYHHEKQHLLPDQGAISGSVAFNSLATALESPTLGSPIAPQAVPQTGHDAANFFLGYAGNYSVGLKRGIMRVREKNMGMYLQDTWKLTQRLTVTPGVRWDINPAFTEESNLLSAFDVESGSLMFPEPLEHYYRLGVTNPNVVRTFQSVGVKFKSAEELGKPKQLFPSNYFDIGPRGGFAYRLTTESETPWILRGGYGLYISAVPMRTLLAQFSGLPPFRANYNFNPNAAAQSPDGIANYLLRTVPEIETGVNSANVIDLDNPASVGRGASVVGMDGKQPSLRIYEWNLAVEKQLSKSTVMRMTYKGKHGKNADQLYNINGTQTDYVWFLTTGRALPTGEFAGVLRRPYNQEAYTDVRLLTRTGYINSSTWALEVERRFRNGLGFQAFYTLTNALRLAGNSFRDDVVNPAAYLPGAVPSDFKALNRFLNYDRDTAIPKHRIRWNWIYDLPVGKGKPFARNARGMLNNLIGGWRLSGTGTIFSTWYTMPTAEWGEMGKFEVYRNKHKILDCRNTPALATSAADERCIEGYLWFNGYISERFINSYNAAGLRNGVFGLPENYKPAQKPVNPWPKGGQPTDPNNADYDTDFVYLPVISGGVQRVNFDTGLHPWRNQNRLGPFNWTMDSSLLKYFNFDESGFRRLRLNVDVFNVFNLHGLNVPNAEGIASLLNSYGGFGIRPRQVQVTMRLEF